MVYNNIYSLNLKNIFNKFKTVHRNNPVLLYVIVFFILIILIDNVLISIRNTPLKIDSEYIIFNEFSNLAEKYKFQEKLFNSLKKLDYADFKIHTIQKGGNYWDIAVSYSASNEHIGIDTIIGLNPYLKNTLAAVNEKLIVCNKKGCLHIIQKNESIKSIAKYYNKPAGLIKKVNKRNIIKDIISPLKKGDVLFIPDSKPRILTEKMQQFYGLRNILSPPIWGKGYTSGFGWRNHPVYKKLKKHMGLDIRARTGKAVHSCSDGVVVYAGWAGGYGKMIKIRHYNNYATAYGHLSRIFVRQGQKTKKGQIIGRSGNTGTSTGPHLDFRVWYKGIPKDPALYLW